MLALTKNIHKIHFYITANSNVQNNFNHHLKKILTLKCFKSNMTAEHGSVDHHIVNCGKVLKSSHHLGQISLSLSLLPSIIPPYIFPRKVWPLFWPFLHFFPAQVRNATRCSKLCRKLVRVVGLEGYIVKEMLGVGGSGGGMCTVLHRSSSSDGASGALSLLLSIIHFWTTTRIWRWILLPATVHHYVLVMKWWIILEPDRPENELGMSHSFMFDEMALVKFAMFLEHEICHTYTDFFIFSHFMLLYFPTTRAFITVENYLKFA